MGPATRADLLVVRRNMNRRRMTDDHHGRMAARATLLARVMDEIHGTHNKGTHLIGVMPPVRSGDGLLVYPARPAAGPTR
jgi:hypothetical protein